VAQPPQDPAQAARPDAALRGARQGLVSRVVYTSEPQLPASRLLSPRHILRDLLAHRELIGAYAKREFQSTHRATYLGLFWTVLSPLMMLALYAFVFGFIFNGKFTQRATETPAEFALALFVGLSFYQCFAACLSGAPSLVVSNAAYVKTLAFPLQVLSVSAVLNALFNLGISIGLSVVAVLVMYGGVHASAVSLILHVICIALIALGVSWFVSALAVFIRDVAAVIVPINVVLMFVSSVFFPLSALKGRVRAVLELNPLAVIVDQARGAFLYGHWPDFAVLGYVFAFSVLVAVLGYWFFMRTKAGFADVI
jgi:lipopolysaccharide transport system permease protein